MKNRHKKIVEILQNRPFMKIEELCDELNVSPATVRRDLALLEDAGCILRINGGAMYNHEAAEPESTGRAPAIPRIEEKTRIAQAAVSLVKEGDTIFIDAGSTNRLIAEYLAELCNITVITNSIGIAYRLNNRKNLSVIICGGALGEADPDSIVGPVAEKMISMFRANLCFVGTSGIDIRQGITDVYLSAARIKENMIENANKVYLVADHSKFGLINTAYVCSLDKIGHIITDKLAPQEDVDFLTRKGIHMLLV